MNELPLTRQSLILRLSQCREDAWDEFLEVYEAAIYRYCRRKGLQDADAHDVTQDVLLAVHKRVGTWDPARSRGSFRGWLFRAARNIAVDALSARSRQAIAGGGSSVTGFISELPETDAAEASAFQLEYRRALFQWAAGRVKAEVQQNTWHSFYRTAVDGTSPEVVANELGVSVGCVYAAKCRVVARLRTILADAGKSS